MNIQVVYMEDKIDNQGGKQPSSKSSAELQDSTHHVCGRICRVQLSDSGDTLYYHDLELKNIPGEEACYVDLVTGAQYRVIEAEEQGNHTASMGIIEIDDDVKDEYWTHIRKLPENKQFSICFSQDPILQDEAVLC